MIRALDRLEREKKDNLQNIRVARTAIALKKHGEDLGVIKKNAFAGNFKQPSSADASLLQSKLSTLSQEGYGIKSAGSGYHPAGMAGLGVNPSGGAMNPMDELKYKLLQEQVMGNGIEEEKKVIKKLIMNMHKVIKAPANGKLIDKVLDKVYENAKYLKAKLVSAIIKLLVASYKKEHGLDIKPKITKQLRKTVKVLIQNAFEKPNEDVNLEGSGFFDIFKKILKVGTKVASIAAPLLGHPEVGAVAGIANQALENSG